MRSYLGITLLIIASAGAAEEATTKMTTTTSVRPELRAKRQLSAMVPIYFDNTPVDAVQPAQPLQPITVVTPVVSNTASLQNPGFLPSFAQNLPLVGPLLANLPLQNLLGGVGNTLGGLNLGNLGLANLPLLGNIAGQKPPGAATTPQSCPITQKLNCRCDPLLPLRVPEPADSSSHLVKILKQNVRRNDDGTSELRLVLSNGVIHYHRNEQSALRQQGYFALPFQKEHYLNIHYSINQSNYTVKADISGTPPKSDFEVWTPTAEDQE